MDRNALTYTFKCVVRASEVSNTWDEYGQIALEELDKLDADLAACQKEANQLSADRDSWHIKWHEIEEENERLRLDYEMVEKSLETHQEIIGQLQEENGRLMAFVDEAYDIFDEARWDVEMSDRINAFMDKVEALNAQSQRKAE